EVTGLNRGGDRKGVVPVDSEGSQPVYRRPNFQGDLIGTRVHYVNKFGSRAGMAREIGLTPVQRDDRVVAAVVGPRHDRGGRLAVACVEDRPNSVCGIQAV